MIITIDGPAGSGKTSAARTIAQRLGIKVLQTGLLYRAAAYVVLRRREFAVGACEILQQTIIGVRDAIVAADIDALQSIEYGYDEDSIFPYVSISGQRMEVLLGSTWLSLPASLISQNPEIRAWSMRVQRSVAQRYSVVAEGRDCGTVVFPNAEFKFFLTASLDVRAQRILQDKSRSALGMTFEMAQKSVQDRDAHDEKRIVAPLIAASGAVVIDCSTMTVDDVVSKIMSVVEGFCHF